MLFGILSGILIGTSYIPFPPWASYFALVPLWIYWIKNKSSLKKILLSGFIAQFTLAIIGFHWIAQTIVEFGMMPLWAGGIVLVLFACTQNLYFILPGIALHFATKNHSRGLAFQVAILTLSMITFETFFPKLFDWNFGYTWLTVNLPIYQTAEWFGFIGLSLYAFIWNAGLTYAWLYGIKNRSSIATIGTLAASFIALNFFGYHLQKKWTEPDQSTRIGVVQANIGNFEKFQAEKGELRPKIYGKYFELTQALIAKDRPDFILWPETAFPDNLQTWASNNRHQRVLRNFVKDMGIPLLTGAYSETEDDEEYYNSFFAINRNGLIEAEYKKTHLLAFGEYFPGSSFLPQVKEWIPAVSHFSKGKGPMAMKLENLKFGPQICYEGLYPEFTAGLAQQGANILINVTNDSWFGHTFEPLQHMYMTLARTIESRIPMVRATNTGITAGILSDGTLLKQSSEQSEWADIYEIPYHSNSPMTVHSRFGFYLPYFGFILWALLMAASLVKPRSER